MTVSKIYMRKIKEENEYTYLTIHWRIPRGSNLLPILTFRFRDLTSGQNEAIAIHIPFSAKNRPGQILHYPNQINSLHDRGEPRTNLLPNPNAVI